MTRRRMWREGASPLENAESWGWLCLGVGPVAGKRVMAAERKGRNAITLSPRVEIQSGRQSAYKRTGRKVGEQFSL